MDTQQTIVIDNGSRMMKAGFGGESAPRHAFLTVVGRPKQGDGPERSHRDLYVGEEVCNIADILSLQWPMDRGVIKNWDDMEKVWRHIFDKQLHVDPAEHPVVLSEHLAKHKQQREKIAQVMFETFSVPSLFLGRSPLLALWESGRVSGAVVDCGDGLMDITCFQRSFPVSPAEVNVPLAGRDLTEYLQRMVNDLTTAAEGDAILDLKEKFGYVAFDFDEEMKKAERGGECNANYTLPNGTTVTIAKERFSCPELLFKPELNFLECDSIHKTLFDCIEKCDSAIRGEMYGNIILSGGSTMFKGLPERLQKEVSRLAPSTVDVKVTATQDPRFAVWVGGSIHSNLADFEKMILRSEDYLEAGPGILHRLFP